MRKITPLVFTLLLVILLAPCSFSQISYKISDESTMTITGTSTIHDWTSKVNKILGDAILDQNVVEKKNLKAGIFASSVKIEFPVLSIESQRGPTMDNKTYNALKSEEHPNILFRLDKSEVKSLTNKSTKEFVVTAAGDLTIAGITKKITLDMNCQKLENNRFSCKGSYPINMTEYEVVPPTAMFGQIKTGEEVTIDFELILFQR
ncbi:YceI family protein [Bacteroidota bacterium]